MTVTLVSGGGNFTVDAGLVQFASVGDRVWRDTNADGVQDLGEDGVADVTVHLFDQTSGLLVATTSTA